MASAAKPFCSLFPAGIGWMLLVSCWSLVPGLRLAAQGTNVTASGGPAGLRLLGSFEGQDHCQMAELSPDGEWLWVMRRLDYPRPWRVGSPAPPEHWPAPNPFDHSVLMKLGVVDRLVPLDGERAFLVNGFDQVIEVKQAGAGNPELREVRAAMGMGPLKCHVSGDGRVFLACSPTRGIDSQLEFEVWKDEAKTGVTLRMAGNRSNPEIRLSHSGHQALMYDRQRMVLFDTESGAPLQSLEVPQSMRDARLSYSGRFLIRDNRGSVQVFDAVTGEQFSVRIPRDGQRTLDVSPGVPWVVCASSTDVHAVRLDGDGRVFTSRLPGDTRWSPTISFSRQAPRVLVRRSGISASLHVFELPGLEAGEPEPDGLP